jgi:phosphomannomutase
MEFGTAGIRGPVTELRPELALAVGRAAGMDAADAETTLVVGRDGRTTGPSLAAAVEAGATSAGAKVRRVGQVPTPVLAFASRGRHGLMLTASHNPPGDNGIKLFADGREYDREAEQRIESRIESPPDPVAWDGYGDTERLSVLSRYREAVATYAGEFGSAATLEVAVDCGNGMASLATPQVLQALGARVVALNANVDGHFRARESKPTPESLTDLRRFVADTDTDLGIGHDGDADRVVVLDGDGKVVHEDTVLAVLAKHYVETSAADDPVVVTTPNASSRIDERVRAAGGRVERVRLGALHEGIAAATGTVVFAGEPWKHVHTAFGGWIDGVTSAAVVTRLVADRGLEPLRGPVTERPYRKVSVACPDTQKPRAMDRLIDRLPEVFPEATVDTEHGLRLELPDGSWLLVRPSGTEPYLRLYAESESVDELVETAREHVEHVAER